jgi:mono/diheme cytochrome c family protein
MSQHALRITAVVLLLMVAAITPALAADAAAGHAVYDKKCKMCHGASGEGNPGMAKALNTTIQPLGSSEVQKMSDADLKKIVTQGKGKMKPPAGLSSAEVDNVIAFVRTLKK